ncbi:MAG: type II secretion system protein GspN [Silvanigrellaceae bacterium]
MDKNLPTNSLIAEDIPVLAADKSEILDNPTLSAVPARSQFGGELWGDTVAHRIKKGKRTKTILTYASVGFVSFLVFLYLSFPFNVVNEVAVSKLNEIFIQQKLPIRISIGSFRPKFPVGANLEDIQVSNVNDSSANVKIGRAVASLNVLPLFIGKIDVDVRLTQSGGSLEVNVNDSIASIIKNARTPSSHLPSGHIRVVFSTFEIMPFVSQALAFVRSGNNPALQTIQPFLRTEVSGQISGVAKIDLPDAGESMDKATADVDLKIGKAYFEMKDETLAIPRQEFSEARIKMKLGKKSIEIPPETKLVANDISVGLSGRMNLMDNLGVNDVKLNLALVLKGKFEENFKTLLPVILGCDLSKISGGKMNVELSGNFSALACN